MAFLLSLLLASICTFPARFFAWISAFIRRLFSRRHEEDPIGLVDMPTEILHSILTIVGERSFRDLCWAKKTCRTLRTAVDNPAYLRGVDLWIMETPNAYLDGIRDFNLRCLESGNPSALFLVGVARFFRHADLGGVVEIREAAWAGYPLAIYAFSNIMRILNPGVEIVGGPIVNPSRALVRAERARVQNTRPAAWSWEMPEMFTEGVDAIDILAIYACRCAPNRSWPRPWDERVKRGDPCDACFWRIHTLWFGREFMKRSMDWPQ